MLEGSSSTSFTPPAPAPAEPAGPSPPRAPSAALARPAGAPVPPPCPRAKPTELCTPSVAAGGAPESRFRGQPEHPQRRQAHLRRVGLSVPLSVVGEHAAEVADAAATVGLGVGVQHLTPASALGQADPETLIHHRREVGHTDQPGTAGGIDAHE